MRVLIVRLDHLGDVLLTTPLMRAAARAGHEVHILVREGCATVFAGNPDVTTHIIERVAPGFPGRWWQLGAWMRRQRFEMILLPYAKPPQLLLASAMSGAKRRIAMWGGLLGRLTLHQCLRSGMASGTRHFSEIPLDCAAAAGFPADGLKPDFYLTAGEIAAARADLAARFPGLAIVGIHPGCAGNTCNLGPEIYGQLAELLLEHPGLAVVSTGITAESPLFAKWPAAVLSHPRFYNACGQWSLRQLAAHVANYATMVVPSTGPLHIAAAYAIPTVTAFCNYPSVSATVWGNLTPGSVVVSPPAEFCERRRAVAKSLHCDFQGQIPVSRMRDAVLQVLAQRAPASLPSLS
jgi:ADP-heptose:LPS heptosyltransferase